MNTKYYTHCPECGEKWIGNPIPLEDRPKYSPPYFYYYLIEIWDWNQENLLEYQCPGCMYKFPTEYDPDKTDIHFYNELKNIEYKKEAFPCPNCDF
jgi:predicted RNA-binding Zn-ribbon protein involved in translation (DUF1610 family)